MVASALTIASRVPFSAVGLGRRSRAAADWLGFRVMGVKSKFLVKGAGALVLSSRPAEEPSTVRIMSPVKLGARAGRTSSLAAAPRAVTRGGRGAGEDLRAAG